LAHIFLRHLLPLSSHTPTPIGLVAQTHVAPHQVSVYSSEITSFHGHPNTNKRCLGRVLKPSTVMLLMWLQRVVGFVIFCRSSTAPSTGLLWSTATMCMLFTCQHRCTKHIEIDIHFVRDKVQVGEVQVLHVPTTSQYADIFTKGLSTATFVEFRSSLTVRDPTADTAGVLD
jgi:hypothetical protein